MLNEETQQGSLRRRGLMLVLSSPSGAGKSTISRALLDGDSQLLMSVSATTRPARPGEIEGTHYFFVDQSQFDEMVAEDAFLEHATVFGNSYGTPRSAVDAALQDGRDVLFDVDWQGTQQIQDKAREDLVSIFVLPPSIEELERRLYSRAQDSEDIVKGRMAKATSEMSHYAEYQYVIVNDDIDRSVAAARAILQAERLKRRRQVGLTDFIRSMGVGQ